jgi:hypothetical protein
MRLLIIFFVVIGLAAFSLHMMFFDPNPEKFQIGQVTGIVTLACFVLLLITFFTEVDFTNNKSVSKNALGTNDRSERT